MKKIQALFPIMILIIFMLLTACNNVRPPGLYFTYDAETDSYIVTNCSDIFYDKSKYYIQSSLPGAVTIPTEYHGKPVTGISERAFLLWINMTSINIPDTVTSIETRLLSIVILLKLLFPTA